MPNLFVNSAEEGEINNSTEIEPDEGNKESDIKIEEITEPQNTENMEVENNSEKITERKSERHRRRPNYYGAITYC